MDGVFSPEKNDTKISHFGEAVIILEHVISSNVGFKNFPSSAKTSLGNMTKRLAIIGRVIQLVSFVNGHSLHQRRTHRTGVKNAHLQS